MSPRNKKSKGFASPNIRPKKIIDIDLLNIHKYEISAQKHMANNNLDSAERIYISLIKEGVFSLSIFQNLAEVFFQKGDNNNSLKYFLKASTLAPNSLKILNRLSLLYQRIDKDDEAKTIYKKIINLYPEEINAQINLGLIYHKLGDLELAIQSYRLALDISNDSAIAHSNIAIAFNHLDRVNEAIKHFKLSIEIEPNNLLTYINLADLFHKNHNYSEAIFYFFAALKISPDNFEVYFALGNVYHDDKQLVRSIFCYKKALRYQRDHFSSILNLGLAIHELGRPKLARLYYLKALSLRPNHPKALNNLGLANYHLGDFEVAKSYYLLSLRETPYFPEAKTNLGILQLTQGDYSDGLTNYNYRFETTNYAANLIFQPDNNKLCKRLSESRELQLISEQGLGDTIQFLRYGIALRDLGYQVSICLDPKLLGLVKYSGIFSKVFTPETVVEEKSSNWLPLLTLPKLLGVEPGKVLIDQPYLRSNPHIVSKWKKKLTSNSLPIIGINWQGNRSAETFNLVGRSIPLHFLSFLSGFQGFNLVSLQKGFGSDQLINCSFKEQFIPNQHLVDLVQDFEETAAIFSCCDLVITTDTCAAHLSGSLGRPTWLILNKTPDWRWGLEGDKSFWYPSIRIFRQIYNNDWTHPLQLMSDQLAKFLSQWN